MERYNIFNLIHKGLRASLYHTALQLQQTDFTLEEETVEALNRAREIIMLFHGHAQKEDKFVLPAVYVYEPSVAAVFGEEHQQDEDLAAALQSCIEKREQAENFLEKLVAGKALIQAFESFTIFNLQHMAKEDQILNQILWRYYSDLQLMEISRSISESIAPWMQDFYATWMLRGINTMEATGWIKAVEASAPPVVFQTLLQKAKSEYSEKKFRKISSSLAEKVLVAG